MGVAIALQGGSNRRVLQENHKLEIINIIYELFSVMLNITLWKLILSTTYNKYYLLETTAEKIFRQKSNW